MSSIRKTQGMNAQPGDFPGGLAVKTPPSNAGGCGWGTTKVPHAVGAGKKIFFNNKICKFEK